MSWVCWGLVSVAVCLYADYWGGGITFGWSRKGPPQLYTDILQWVLLNWLILWLTVVSLTDTASADLLSVPLSWCPKLSAARLQITDYDYDFIETSAPIERHWITLIDYQNDARFLQPMRNMKILIHILRMWVLRWCWKVWNVEKTLGLHSKLFSITLKLTYSAKNDFCYHPHPHVAGACVPYQIWSKSDNSRLRYGDNAIFVYRHFDNSFISISQPWIIIILIRSWWL